MSVVLSTAVFSALSTYAPLTALVGTRIFPHEAQQEGTAPYVVFQRISNVRETGHDGDQALGSARYQFTAWSPLKSDVSAIREVLIGLNGQTLSVTGGSITFLHADDRDGFDTETQQQSESVDLYLWHG